MRRIQLRCSKRRVVSGGCMAGVGWASGAVFCWILVWGGLDDCMNRKAVLAWGDSSENVDTRSMGSALIDNHRASKSTTNIYTCLNRLDSFSELIVSLSRLQDRPPGFQFCICFPIAPSPPWENSLVSNNEFTSTTVPPWLSAPCKHMLISQG